MPYLLLIIGLLIGAYALYRFFIKADVLQIKAFFMVVVTVVLATALFFMAVTGRLPAAIALIAALVPFGVGYLRQKYGSDDKSQTSDQQPAAISSREEALEILGLSEGASQKEIKDAYKKLMQKVHPDHEGSEWMAAKLNQARDLLLDKSSPDT